ncbi:HEPN family nuclease [Marinobacterium sp. BA1]|uniref:HEPN family nuclease n=1 Tax=Marinobacterium sp. BA1 TaxID=3138931 RepID=UPI0032E67F4F
MQTSTNWNVLIQGFLSLIWCQESINPKNQGKQVVELLSEFRAKNEGINPLNIGSMLSAAYLCFMYPQQSEFKKMDFSAVDVSHFNVVQGSSADSKYICRRIRNSLAHARFEITDNGFVFYDVRPDGSDEFKAEIKIEFFGDFLNNFFFEAKSQHFHRGVA